MDKDHFVKISFYTVFDPFDRHFCKDKNPCEERTASFVETLSSNTLDGPLSVRDDHLTGIEIASVDTGVILGRLNKLPRPGEFNLFKAFSELNVHRLKDSIPEDPNLISVKGHDGRNIFNPYAHEKHRHLIDEFEKRSALFMKRCLTDSSRIPLDLTNSLRVFVVDGEVKGEPISGDYLYDHEGDLYQGEILAKDQNDCVVSLLSQFENIYAEEISNNCTDSMSLN